MTNVARQIGTITAAKAFQQLDKLKTHIGGRFAYLNYFQFHENLRFVRWIRHTLTGSLRHSEFQDAQGRLGLK